MNKFFKNVTFYLLIIIVMIWMFDYYSGGTEKKDDMSYTSFLQHVQQDDIKQVTIVDNIISGKLKDGQEFSTVVPDDDTLISRLECRNQSRASSAAALVDWNLKFYAAYAAYCRLVVLIDESKQWRRRTCDELRQKPCTPL